MSRLALFTVSLLIIVAIGSQPRFSASSIQSMCVCVPTRAGLLVKSAIAKTQARVRSVELSTSRAVVTQ
jgi:hypothetical protein